MVPIDSLEIEADHAALMLIARRLRVSVNINRRALHSGRPWVELFTRGMMLNAFWDFNDAAAWLQAGRQQGASQ